MNKKQIISLWIMVAIVSILIGLKTTTVYRLEEMYKPNGPETGHTALMLYGTMLMSSANAGVLHPLLNFGTYKYHLMLVVLLLGLTSIFTFKSKYSNS